MFIYELLLPPVLLQSNSAILAMNNMSERDIDLVIIGFINTRPNGYHPRHRAFGSYRGGVRLIPLCGTIPIQSILQLLYDICIILLYKVVQNNPGVPEETYS